MCVLNSELYCAEHTSSLFYSSALFRFVNYTELFLRVNFLLNNFLSGLLSSSFLSSSFYVIGSGHSGLMCPFCPQLWQVFFSSILLFAVQIYYYYPVVKMRLPKTQVISLLGSTACIRSAIGKLLPYCEDNCHYPSCSRFLAPQLDVRIA